MRCTPLLLFCLVWLFFAQTTFGGAAQVQDLTAPEVKKMVEEDGAQLVHVLSEIEFAMQHIPGSINIPITKVATSDRLGPAKDQPVIFYCMGTR